MVVFDPFFAFRKQYVMLLWPKSSFHDDSMDEHNTGEQNQITNTIETGLTGKPKHEHVIFGNLLDYGTRSGLIRVLRALRFCL